MQAMGCELVGKGCSSGALCAALAGVHQCYGVDERPALRMLSMSKSLMIRLGEHRESRPLAKLTLSAARVEELARPEMPFSVLAADAMGIKYAVCELAEICIQLGQCQMSTDWWSLHAWLATSAARGDSDCACPSSSDSVRASRDVAPISQNDARDIVCPDPCPF